MDSEMVKKLIVASMVVVSIFGCINSYESKYGNCMDNAAMSVFLDKDAKVAYWSGKPGHVQAFVPVGDSIWLQSMWNGIHYTVETTRDNSEKPISVFDRNKYIKWYLLVREVKQ